MSVTGTERGHRKERVGVVVSDRMQKTVVVQVEWRERHPLYHKEVRKTSKFHAHDEQGRAKKGDRVRIAETRPLSKTKHWRVVEVLDRAQEAAV
jgi:small subunit ribosomal protein S17